MFRKLHQWFSRFRKAPSGSSKVVYPVGALLTEQVIDSTPDDKLLRLIFDHLSEKLPEDYMLEFATVMGWNRPRQAIYMIGRLEAEVNYGGFNHFYYNSSGQYYEYLPAALFLVGAKKFAALTRHANATYERESARITQHQDGSLKGFSKSYEDNPLNRLDNEFYALYENEDLQGIQVAYIREHTSFFIDP